jgi:hypothetical protein
MTERKTRPRAAASVLEICPHLGIAEDIQTCLAYPSYWNLCHRARPASVVRLGHQRNMCLSPAHLSCTVFQCKLISPLPVELRGQHRTFKKALSKKSENT